MDPTDGPSRRTVLKGLGAAAAASTGLATTASARRSGFPPSGITEWSDPVALGDGRAGTFASVTPSGRPTFLGVRLSADATDGLPSPAAVAEREDGVRVHGAWSLPIPLALPDAAPDPFGYFGFAWNPEGHPPDPVYGSPHFDVHFYVREWDAVDGICGGPATYDLPAERVPEGYERLRNPAGEVPVVHDMGEHLVDPSSPEFSGGSFANTLLYGAYDFDDDGAGELHFVEPMLTREYLRGLTGVDRRPVPQPDRYPESGWYPTAYSVRASGTGDLVVALEGFEERSGGYR